MPPRNRSRLLTAATIFIAAVSAVSVRESSADDRQREIAILAREVLARRCFACHGLNGIARKNVFVGDRDHLIASQTVVPGDPNSLLLRMIQSGAMPEGGPPLPDEERSILREWVIAGAPKWDDDADSPRRAFIDEQMILALIEQDVLNQPQRDRQFLRYFSLMHLYNAGVSQREMET
ncbi:MAG TPA: cytochrome c [Blastocatellia bacterium]